MHESVVRILCVDDNPSVIEAMRTKLAREPGFAFVGGLRSADRLADEAEDAGADVVLLDIDMPGRSPFDALAELSERLPDARALMLSGYVSRDYVDRAIDAGAWGYLSKSDATGTIMEAIRHVMRGEFIIGPEVLRQLDGFQGVASDGAAH